MNTPIFINTFYNALELITRFNKEVNVYGDEKENLESSQKFLKYGDVFGCMDENGNNIISMLNMYCNDYDSGIAYICNIYVKEKYRNLGIARKMIGMAINVARNRKFNFVRLHVDDKNMKAIKLYKSIGFETRGIDKHGLVEMTLKLNDFAPLSH